MGNLVDIQRQIEKLQSQATDIKAREFDKTVREILAKMQAFGITVDELRVGKTRPNKVASAGSTRRANARQGAKPPVTVPPKYRGPNGETWTGRGLTPRWLAALIASGMAKESYLIEP